MVYILSFPSADNVWFTSNTMFGYNVGKSFKAVLMSNELDADVKGT